MEHIAREFLPKERHVREIQKESREIKTVSDYIDRVDRYILARGGENSVVVYRGVPKIYPFPCRPNIFRKGVMEGNPFFERSLFNAMRQSNLTGEKRYLDNAIDAQHGEFPSRLLDVTYNCLTALYFAVTPYYREKEDSKDGEAGMVFLFFVDDIFSPSARNTNDNYDAIINRDKPWFNGRKIFQKNHKFIDHIKLNSRIIAQQGAFILFQGDEAEDLPAYMTYGIRIPPSAKPRLRHELKQMFGIHTGSIYPEIINLVEDISQKSRRLNTRDFTWENELAYGMDRLEKELEYYLDYAVDQHRNGGENTDQILLEIEKIINSYRVGIVEFVREFPLEDRTQLAAGMKGILERYQSIVHEFADELVRYGIGSVSLKSLEITL